MPSRATTRSVLAFLATSAAAATLASAAELGADARPPPFFPQRADNLILRGVEAGGPASLAALDGVPCRGNACGLNGGAPAVRGEFCGWPGCFLGGARPRDLLSHSSAAPPRRRPVQCGGAARTLAPLLRPISLAGQ
jgi:hypothetical protein